jgi:hypothetical protein
MVGDLHFADAEDRASVILGKQLYRVHCAGCHGRNLQGQPLWQLADAYAGRRAPAFDETGYAWQHSDEEIFHATKYGRPVSGAPAAMPAFEHRMRSTTAAPLVAILVMVATAPEIAVRAKGGGVAGDARSFAPDDVTLRVGRAIGTGPHSGPRRLGADRAEAADAARRCVPGMCLRVVCEPP